MNGSPYVIEYERAFTFPVRPQVVWSAMEQTERFECWWAWLTEVRVDGPPLRDGSSLHGVVSPPLPYRMRLDVLFDRCDPVRSVTATVGGDLVGRAHLVLEPDGGETRVTAGWTVEMMQPPMRVAARLAPRLLQWGHDRVVDATVVGFRRHLVAAPRD